MKRHRHGVTLIEIVASLAIIGIGVVGILALFPIAIEAGARAGAKTESALLLEYAIEQTRLLAPFVPAKGDTEDCLRAIGLEDYEDDGEFYTWNAEMPLGRRFGSGEYYETGHLPLTGQHHYSKYELAFEFTPVRKEDGSFSTAHTNQDGSLRLMQVTVYVRWPRASTPKEQAKQQVESMVTYIRPDRPDEVD